ncbi:hypothetical protein [Halalkalibaculum sp. DA384]|uniref:hypothetical protein n=1 Tax=Halalkalibaculum sp. DA384 TaxID=3373606 RepID=UPI0037553490
MRIANRLSKLLGIVVLAVGIAACGDNSTNPVETPDPTPPELPELQSYQPETEYFNNNSTQNKSVQNGAAFGMASEFVQSNVHSMFGITQVYMPFFEQARETEPTFDDGVWEWTYSYTYPQVQQSAELRLTAEPNDVTGETSWELFVSVDVPDGPSLDNYRFMSGTSSSDGNEGSWSVYTLGENGSSGEAVFTFEWSREDEDNFTSSYTIHNTGSAEYQSVNFDYTKAVPEHTLHMHSSDGEFDVEIFWNTETDIGYVNYLGDKMCWDSNFEDTACQ